MKETIIIRKNSSGASNLSAKADTKQGREVCELYLRTLAPIHIGCDEVYEPICFVMDESSGNMKVFDTEIFLESLNASERKEFSDICKEGSIASILKIYKFISKHKPQGREIKVSPGLLGHYKKTLALPINNEKILKNELNRFSIARTSFLPTTDRPYIPGSALKGALRTAYLNYLDRSVKTEFSTLNARELERNLMGGTFDKDPFRFLKISDFMPVGNVRTEIVYAINQKKKTSEFKASGPYQILEVIPPGSEFTGTVEFSLRSEHGNQPLTSDALFSGANEFFGNERKIEENILQQVNVQTNIDHHSPSTLLRIGRHSGAESVTIAAHRNIRIKKPFGGGDTFEKASTTIWLASPYDDKQPRQKLEPFGWVELVKASSENLSKMDEIEADWRKAFEETQAELLSNRRQKYAVQSPVSSAPKAPVEEVWNSAVLSWDPGRRQLTAVMGSKKAFAGGTDMIPESMQKAVVQKKKAVKANVTVNSSFRILKIEPV